MLTEITAIGGLIGLIASLVLLAWQTREVAKQTRISNAIAGAAGLGESTNHLREVLVLFVDRPELRSFFYDGKPCPRRGPQRIRVITIADMLADVLEVGLVTTRLIPSTESYEDWLRYSRYMLAHSPVLVDFVREHPDWFPQLALLLPFAGVEEAAIP